MRIRSLAVLALAVVMVFALTACGGGGDGNSKQGDKIKIKFSHVTTNDSPKGQAANYFKDLVEERTDGKVVVEVFPSSQLYGDAEELEALIANNVQMIAPSATKLVGFNPSFQIYDLPFLFKDNESVYEFFNHPDGGKKMLASLEKNGMRGLTHWPNGFKHFTNSKHPLTKPADFHGLKFRTQTGQVLSAQMEAVGAGAQAMPFAEVYTALQQGTVDGQENTFNNIDTQSYVEVQKYFTVSNHGRLDYAIIANASFWDGLPDDIRTIVSECLDEATDLAIELAEKLDQESFENIKNSGKVEIYELTEEDRAEFQKVMHPVWEKYAKNIGQDLIDVAITLNE